MSASIRKWVEKIRTAPKSSLIFGHLEGVVQRAWPGHTKFKLSVVPSSLLMNTHSSLLMTGQEWSLGIKVNAKLGEHKGLRRRFTDDMVVGELGEPWSIQK